MKRRQFLKTSLAASTLAGLTSSNLKVAAAEADSVSGRDFYELRIYRLQDGAGHALLDAYLAEAAIPAWNRLGIKPIGAFTEIAPKGGPAVYVLIPYPSVQSFATAGARLEADSEYKKAGAAYLEAPKSKPAFDRIDSSLMLAFIGLPRLEMPALSRQKKPRIFELRSYQSHSELKAIKKVEMFNAGEIDVMREVGLGPVFYGQTLIGSDLPHLTYMLSGENQEAHKKHWGGFSNHPIWNKLKNDPQYADTVSKISNWFLAPTSYSQI
jgi:NIPSNAP